LQPLIQNAAPQGPPSNFQVVNARGGFTVSWSPVDSSSGADGYEILKSPNGSFTDDLQVIPVKDVNQSSYFDSTGGNVQTASYRIRTTSGTAANPQAQRGPEGGVIRHTSLDATDTKSTPVAKIDSYTNDAIKSLARKGNYGAIKPSTQAGSTGTRGQAGIGSGTNPTSGTTGTGGAPISGTLPFSSLTSGSNNNANMLVSGNGNLAPDPSNPGTVSANEVNGAAVPASATLLSSNSFGQIIAASVGFITSLDCNSSSGLLGGLDCGVSP